MKKTRCATATATIVERGSDLQYDAGAADQRTGHR